MTLVLAASAAGPVAGPVAGRRPLLVLAGLGLAIVSVGVLRLLLFGWASVAPDDANYLFVGLSWFAGDGPVTQGGTFFLQRSPVYGIVLAAGAQLSADPLMGARIVAASLTLAGLVGAIGLAWLIGGSVAAAGTTLCLIAMPLIWRLVPTLRIDLPQTAGVVAVLIAMRRPTVRRWAAAGAILGFTILVKETILLLVALPVAAVGMIPSRVLARLGAVYVIAAGVVAGWWWVVVWRKAGVLFPTNAIGTIERREVGADVRIDLYGLVLLVLVTGSWLYVAWRARKEIPARFLVAAAGCLAAPAIYATLNGLSARNYAGLAVLSAIAVGVAAAGAGDAIRTNATLSRRARLAVWPVIAGLLLAGAVIGQVRTGIPVGSVLPGQIADWLRPEVKSGNRVIMTFHDSDVIALELFKSAAVPELQVSPYGASEPLGAYLWLGLRDQKLFGYRRTTWTSTLGNRAARYLVLAGPHELTPAELVPALNRGLFAGVRRAQFFDIEGEWARIYRVVPERIVPQADVPLHLSPAAAQAWLDLAGAGTDGAAREQQLIDAGPVIVGRTASAVLDGLVAQACLVPADEGRDAFRLAPATEANASVPGAVCD